MSRDRRKKSGVSLIGLVIWVVAAVALVIMFLANKKRIFGNLKATGFFERVFGSTPKFIEDAEVPEEKIAKNDVDAESDYVEIQLVQGAAENEDGDSILYTNLPNGSKKKTGRNETVPETKDPVADTAVQETLDYDDVTDLVASGSSVYGSSEDEAFGVYSDQNSSIALESVGVQSSTTEPAHSINPNLIYEPNTTDPVKSPTDTPAENISLRLFFIEINSDGTSSICEVPRLMKKSATPLSDSINALIDGPTPAEQKSHNCRTMVSPGTRLLSASVKNGIATLNFSEELEFNNFGIEGIMWELDQIVYTATAFPSVQKVQFLIEGTHREYISEGLRIGEPLGRESL